MRELGAIDGDGRITDEGQRLRALPLPPRLARMVVEAGAEGAGETAAAIAAMLTERGLGGDDLDLRHRLDQFRRDRSRRAEEARAMVEAVDDVASTFFLTSPIAEGRAGRSTGAESLPRPNPHPARCAGAHRVQGEVKQASARCLPSPIPTALPRTAAAGAAPSCSPMAAAARRCGLAAGARAFLAVAELTGSAAAGRIMLAAPITLAEIEARFAGQIEDRDAVTFRCRLRLAARAALAPARRPGAGRADPAGHA